ncbi:MAG: HepT-like ribonuclease domain-containing protein [Bacteroidales bacterium]
MFKDPVEYLKHIQRDRLIHDYMGINYSIVLDVVKNKIPELSKQIAEVIEKEQNNTDSK